MPRAVTKEKPQIQMSQSSPAPGTIEYYHRAMGWFYTLQPKLLLFIESPPSEGKFFYIQTGHRADLAKPLR